MKKKITAALVCAIMALSLAGCAANEGEPESTKHGKSTKDESSYSENEKKPDESKPEDSSPTESSTDSKPEESSSDSKPTGSSTESTPESKPEDNQPVDPIDWSTVPYADELDFLYEDYKDGIAITEYRGEETIIKIPETINGKTVIALDKLPYSVIGVSIPKSVTEISMLCFSYRDSLQSVVLPDNLKIRLGSRGTSQLLFNNGVAKNIVYTYLGKTYRMPEDQIKLGDAMYPGTGKMSISDDGTLNKVSIAIKDVVIPDNVTSIKASAFSDCDLIEDITIPGSITEINGGGGFIFNRCPNLKSVTFAEGVTKIDGGIFFFCPKLETIALPDSLKHIKEGCFTGAEPNSGVPKNLQVTFKGVTYKSNQLQDLYKAVNG